MSGETEELACDVLPPVEGNINVLAITTSASSLQTIDADRESRRYITVECDVAFGIVFGTGTSLTDPSLTAAGATAGKCWRIPADDPRSFLLPANVRNFKAIGSASGNLRWYLSSP